jgi:hypothetical protein
MRTAATMPDRELIEEANRCASARQRKRRRGSDRAAANHRADRLSHRSALPRSDKIFRLLFPLFIDRIEAKFTKVEKPKIGLATGA